MRGFQTLFSGKVVPYYQPHQREVKDTTKVDLEVEEEREVMVSMVFSSRETEINML